MLDNLTNYLENNGITLTERLMTNGEDTLIVLDQFVRDNHLHTLFAYGEYVILWETYPLSNSRLDSSEFRFTDIYSSKYSQPVKEWFSIQKHDDPFNKDGLTKHEVSEKIINLETNHDNEIAYIEYDRMKLNDYINEMFINIKQFVKEIQ